MSNQNPQSPSFTKEYIDLVHRYRAASSAKPEAFASTREENELLDSIESTFQCLCENDKQFVSSVLSPANSPIRPSF